MPDRVKPVFRDRLPAILPDATLLEMTELLADTVYGRNYDTFSFMFELLEQDRSLLDAYLGTKIDSLEYLNKYNGTNCAGLAQKLAMEIRQRYDGDSIIMPSFGEVVPRPVDSAYAGVKTSALLVRGEGEEEYVLDPALAIDTIVPVLETAQDTSMAYALSSKDDARIQLFMPTSKGVREMHFQREDLENADESMQRNWLRARTKYKICRRYPSGDTDFITYEFTSDKFKVTLGAIGIRAVMFSPNEMEDFIDEYDDKIIDTFSSDLVIAGMKRFIASRQVIVEDLLIPPIKKGLALYASADFFKR